MCNSKWSNYKTGDFIQVENVRPHPDTGSETFWRNALFCSVIENDCICVVYGNGQTEVLHRKIAVKKVKIDELDW